MMVVVKNKVINMNNVQSISLIAQLTHDRDLAEYPKDRIEFRFGVFVTHELPSIDSLELRFESEESAQTQYNRILDALFTNKRYCILEGVKS